jgi:hypothetical protein
MIESRSKSHKKSKKESKRNRKIELSEEEDVDDIFREK